MARKERTMVTIVDDLTGEEQKEGDGATVSFVWQGKAYEIDLSDYNAAKFVGVMAPYVEKARRVRNSPAATASPVSHAGGDGRRRGGGRGMGRSKDEIAEIRAWARANGHAVADSGLIPKRIVEAWEKRETIPTTPPAPRPSPVPRTEVKAPATVPPVATSVPVVKAEDKAPETETKAPERVNDTEKAGADNVKREPVPTTPAAPPASFQSPGSAPTGTKPTPEPEPDRPGARHRVFGRGSDSR